MAIPGYRWIRGLVPEATYDAASKVKDLARVTWDDAIATSLALYVECLAPKHIVQVAGPAAASATTVIDAAAQDVPSVAADPTTPETPISLSSVEEIQRREGHP